MPPSKISLGLAAYHDYCATAYDVRTGSRGVGRDIGYTEVMKIIADAGATTRWDATQKATTAMLERNGVFEHAWIDDARAFEEKLPLVKQYGLLGYSVWVLGSEDPAVWSVVGTVAK